jgi:hypothetical protein
MADELDMVNRDPNGMNSHVQVIWNLKNSMDQQKSQQYFCKKTNNNI